MYIWSFKLRSEGKATVFSFPKEEHLQKILKNLINKKDLEPTNSSSICIKHFEDKYCQKGKRNKWFRLIKTLKPVPKYLIQVIQTSRIFSLSGNLVLFQERVYQEDQYQRFIADNVIKNFTDVNESLCLSGYSFQQYDDRVVFFKLINIFFW